MLMDEAILAADPDGVVRSALLSERMNRLRAAKRLTSTSSCLQAVPAAARDRLLELLQAQPEDAGITQEIAGHLHDFAC